MMIAGLLVLAIAAIPATLSCVYLAAMTLLSWAPPPPPRSARKLKFDVIVPAHNETLVIERVVGSLKKLDWPAAQFRVLVVADNCSDDTAALARAAGAGKVLERSHASLRGKGHALDYAFAISREEAYADAVVVVDADSEATPNLLEAFAVRIERGAAAIQAHFGVLNPGMSWRTRLLTIAQAAFHDVRSRSRERLRVSCGVRGNGWCVTHDLLKRVPYAAYSLAEDLEFGIELGLAGVRVHYVDEAHVLGEMVSGAQNAATQRQRWEDGRFQMIRTRSLPLLRAAFTRPSKVCFDLACDLLVLPLSYVALNVAALLVLTALIQPDAGFWYWLDCFCLASLVFYVLRGWQLSKQGLRGLVDLGRAPFFVAWKLLVMLRRRTSAEWIRTKRERP